MNHSYRNSALVVSVHTSTICSVSTQLATFPSASAPRINNRVPTRSALRLRTTISQKMQIYSVNFKTINGAVFRILRMNLKRRKNPGINNPISLWERNQNVLVSFPNVRQIRQRTKPFWFHSDQISERLWNVCSFSVLTLPFIYQPQGYAKDSFPNQQIKNPQTIVLGF